MWLLEGIKAADDDRLPCSLFPTFCPRQEYKRLETLRQIKEADRRTEEMVARKEDMINQRRKAALEVRYGTVWYGGDGHPKEKGRPRGMVWHCTRQPRVDITSLREGEPDGKHRMG